MQSMPTADQIVISKLKVKAIIGVYPEERKAPQALQIDLKLLGDFSQACQSDQLTHAIDYATVCAQIEQWASQTNFQLLEAFAEALAQKLLQNFALQAVNVAVFKPNLFGKTKRVGVEIYRSTPV